jgi:AcrR family transcriptional regulator
VSTGSPLSKDKLVRSTPRRTQEERSAETRRKLIQATIDALDERGYARITTVEIARRAGVSRGALMHHFSTKEELVSTSVEKHLEDSTLEIRGFLDMARNGEMSLDTFLDRLWEMYSGKLLFVTLEHITEARHNGPLRENLIPVVRRFHAALDATWREFFRGTALSEDDVETVLNASTCMFRGMGVQTILRTDAVYYDRLLRHWKAHVHNLVALASSR